MKIIVTGSLGHIGKPLTGALVQKGHSVTVISSKAAKQPAIEAMGAAAAIGSLEDIDFLLRSFAGADAIFAMVPPNYAEPDQTAYYRRLADNYAQAARQSGVKHIVHLSSYGAHLDKGTGQILCAHHAESILNELTGVMITHLRPGYFYYNLYGFTDMIREQGIMGANYGGADKLMLVAPADIAAAAAEELLTTASGNNVRYVVSDDISANEAAHIIGTAIGKPDLQWLIFSDEQMKDSLVKSGMAATFAASMTELGASIHNGTLRQDYDQHAPITPGKIKLQEFAKEFAVVYNQSL